MQLRAFNNPSPQQPDRVEQDLWKCVGSVSSTMFNYNFGIVDAKGIKTQTVPADGLCTE